MPNAKVSEQPGPSRSQPRPTSNKTVTSDDEESQIKTSESCHIKGKYPDISTKIPEISNRPNIKKTTASDDEDSSRNTRKKRHNISNITSNTSQLASDVQKCTNINRKKTSFADQSKCSRRLPKYTTLKKLKSKNKTSKKCRRTPNLKEKVNSLNLTASSPRKTKTTTSKRSSSNAQITKSSSFANSSKSPLTSEAEDFISERNMRSLSHNKQTKTILKPTKAKPKLPAPLPLVRYGTMDKDCHKLEDTLKEETSIELHGNSKSNLILTTTKVTASRRARSASNVLITEILATEPTAVQITPKKAKPGSKINTSSFAHSSASPIIEPSLNLDLNPPMNLYGPLQNESIPRTMKPATITGAGSSPNVVIFEAKHNTTKNTSKMAGSVHAQCPPAVVQARTDISSGTKTSNSTKVESILAKGRHKSIDTLIEELNLSMNLRDRSKKRSRYKKQKTTASSGAESLSNAVICEASETEPSKLKSTSEIAASDEMDRLDEEFNMIMDLHGPSKKETKRTKKKTAASITAKSSSNTIKSASNNAKSKIAASNKAKSRPASDVKSCTDIGSETETLSSIKVESLTTDISISTPGTSKVTTLKKDRDKSIQRLNEEFNKLMDLLDRPKESKPTTIRNASSIGRRSLSNSSSETNTLSTTAKSSFADHVKSLSGMPSEI